MNLDEELAALLLARRGYDRGHHGLQRLAVARLGLRAWPRVAEA
jgi:hypothetical protein